MAVGLRIRGEERRVAAAVAVSVLIAVLAGLVAYALPAPGLGGTRAIQLNITFRGLNVTYSARFFVGEEGVHLLYLAPGLRLGGGSPQMVVLQVSCPRGSYWFVAGPKGGVVNTSARGEAARLLGDVLREAGLSDVVGCFSPGGFASGASYSVEARLAAHVPVVCGGGLCLIDVEALRPGHLPAAEARIKVAAAKALKLLPPTLRVKNLGSAMAEAGPIRSDQALRVLALVPEEEVPMVLRRSGDPLSALQARLGEARKALAAAEVAAAAAVAYAAAAPLLGLVLYKRWGTERRPGDLPGGVPPETGEEPWVVNLRYVSDAGVLTPGAVTGTVVRLVERGVLSLEEEPGVGPVLRLPDNPGRLQGFEKKVVDLLYSLAEEGSGEIVLRNVERRLSSPTGVLREQLHDMLHPEPWRMYYEEALEKRRPLFAFLTAAGVMGAGVAAIALARLPLGDYSVEAKAVAAWLLAGVAYVPHAAQPSYVYGRWRKGYLENMLAWQRFRHQARRLVEEEKDPEKLLKIAAYLEALDETSLAEKALEKAGYGALKPLLRSLRGSVAAAAERTR